MNVQDAREWMRQLNGVPPSERINCFRADGIDKPLDSSHLGCTFNSSVCARDVAAIIANHQS